MRMRTQAAVASAAWSCRIGSTIGLVEPDGFHFYAADDLHEIGAVPLQYACHVEFLEMDYGSRSYEESRGDVGQGIVLATGGMKRSVP